MLTRFSSLSFEDTKIIFIVKLILHVPDALELLIISLKHGLIFLKHSSIDIVSFSSPVFTGL